MQADFRVMQGQECDAVFVRMQEEGLLPFAMHAHAAPRLQDWQELTAREDVVLVGGYAPGPSPMGAALLTPWRGAVWEFDFTVFRSHFAQAVPLARAALGWIFSQLPCTALVGLCPVPNRHAWRLAEQAGFSLLGRVPSACWFAKYGKYVDGVLVMAASGQKNVV